MINEEEKVLLDNGIVFKVVLNGDEFVGNVSVSEVEGTIVFVVE